VLDVLSNACGVKLATHADCLLYIRQTDRRKSAAQRLPRVPVRMRGTQRQARIHPLNVVDNISQPDTNRDGEGVAG